MMMQPKKPAANPLMEIAERIREMREIVGYTEADPAKLFISAESPIGAALVGKHVGEVAEAHTPGGVIRLVIREIKRR